MKKQTNLFAQNAKYSAPECFAFAMVSGGLMCISYGEAGDAGSQIPYIDDIETY